MMFAGASIQKEVRCYGLDVSMETQRCIHIPTSQEISLGRMTACPHCQNQEDCLKCEERIFTVSFLGMTRDTREK